jgi:hypothetical protein
MIKINLLLARKDKKKVGRRKEFIVLILSIVLSLVSDSMEIRKGKRGYLNQNLRHQERNCLLQISDHGSQ